MQNFYNQAKSNALGVAEYFTPVLKVRNMYLLTKIKHFFPVLIFLNWFVCMCFHNIFNW